MKVKIYLSGHLKSLFPELSKEIVLEVEKPISVDELANRLGITPWIIMSAIINGQARGKDHLINEDNAEITLIGPMAGG
jgi:molybdopterin converting factor small subunit